MRKRYSYNYSGKLKAVIFDWAGTTVDYGCFAPTGVFIEIFRQKGVEITEHEARGPMGIHKRDHIKALTLLPRIAEEWQKLFGSTCSEKDIDEMYEKFIPLQLDVIGKYSQVVKELPRAVDVIRSLNMKIGTTTGYNNEMMKVLSESAASQGYIPDSIVCASDVSMGRPAPWMAFRNAEKLSVYPMQAILKIGDTVADIQEGLNAGMWSVGVVSSSNEMGLAKKDFDNLSPDQKFARMKEVRDRFFEAGAHFVIDSLLETEELITIINEKLAD
jgi:phosphonoacetaldehyde hydrolase